MRFTVGIEKNFRQTIPSWNVLLLVSEITAKRTESWLDTPWTGRITDSGARRVWLEPDSGTERHLATAGRSLIC